MESFFEFCFRNKWYRTHFTKFLYISCQFVICKRRTKKSRLKDFETRGREFSNFNPFKSTCGGLSV